MSVVKRLLSKINPDHSDRTKEQNVEDSPRSSLDPAAARRAQRRSFEAEDRETRREEKARENEDQAKERETRRAEARESDPLKANYGPLDLESDTSERQSLSAISSKQEGDSVSFRARIHNVRALSAKIVFIVLRQQMSTVQGVLAVEDDLVSENMVRWTEGLSRGSIVLVKGKIQAPKGGQDEVTGATIHQSEVKIEQLFLIAEPTVPLPFQVDDAGRAKETLEGEDSHFNRVGERTRLDNRVVDLRTPTSQAIFRIHSALTRLFREFFYSHNFIEVHTSKFEESGVESGASLFKVDYFGRPAFLAQSPQVGKQMCIAADMERVFEVGPVFRAENSNTHRHLTEFTGLDMEMAIERHYSEVVNLLDEMFLHIFKGLQSQYSAEIETVKRQYPHDDLVFLDETLRLKFAEGIQLLREAGWKEEDGSEPSEYEDLSTKGEQRLGQIVKEKYNTDYYILDKFPLAARPFYTMSDPENDKLSNSYDFFVRGEEILSGGQRINHAPLLEERMKAAGVDPESMKDYMDGFRWGCPPHGGGGIGLERVVMLFLKLGNIRWASLFPRDPRSFAKAGKVSDEVADARAQQAILHGPESSTFRAAESEGELPPLENLIAKYGDGTNTSWVDPAWTVWRDPATGGAVGYMSSNGYAVAFGNPLCELRQVPELVPAYLEHLKKSNLQPVWCCVEREAEQYLTRELGWSSLIAVAEEKLNPTEVDPEDDKNVRRKLRRTEREGVKIIEVEGEPDEDLRNEIEKKLQRWRDSREGKQVHLTGVRPFDDMAHRRYFYGRDKDGEICCLVVLAELAAARGFQIKWALEIPGAPSGSIEYILSHVIKKLGDAGVRSATFGPGATDRLERVENIGGIRIRMLEKTYNGISSGFNLTNKGDFRSKFGVHQEPLYICYPKGRLGAKGVKAVMNVVMSDK